MRWIRTLRRPAIHPVVTFRGLRAADARAIVAALEKIVADGRPDA